MDRFLDRNDAGIQLAEAVAKLGLADPVVLALPRGGVPVAAPVADRLGAPLDLVMVRKIGCPGNPELAAGAVVNGASPQTVFNADILRHLGMAEADFAGAVARELETIERRRNAYLAGRAAVPLRGRDAVVVDDGIATGATVKVALKAMAGRGPASLTLAVPTAPADSLAALKSMVDHLVCLVTPEPFWAVGQAYQRFGQTSDEEVVGALQGSGPAS
ncbi:MAG: phosphoribosyltransferase family protein [Rhodobacter sp.]|nr:phosphoribosyltransferase family protein [Rhodobacter sp.]